LLLGGGLQLRLPARGLGGLALGLGSGLGARPLLGDALLFGGHGFGLDTGRSLGQLARLLLGLALGLGLRLAARLFLGPGLGGLRLAARLLLGLALLLGGLGLLARGLDLGGAARFLFGDAPGLDRRTRA